MRADVTRLRLAADQLVGCVSDGSYVLAAWRPARFTPRIHGEPRRAHTANRGTQDRVGPAWATVDHDRSRNDDTTRPDTVICIYYVILFDTHHIISYPPCITFYSISLFRQTAVAHTTKSSTPHPQHSPYLYKISTVFSNPEKYLLKNNTQFLVPLL